MGKEITRRDFFDGVACAIVASSVAPGLSYARGADAPYPPARAGYGGSRPEDFSIAHGVRDGLHYDLRGQPVSERYDVVVIGGGIGGVAALQLPTKARPETR